MKRAWQAVAIALLGWLGVGVQAQELPEYRLKAAFVYNFIAFTDWPANTASTLNLCIHGPDPFGPEIEGLHGKPVNGRSIALQRKVGVDALRGCHIVFVGPQAQEALPRVLDTLRGQPVLTIADSTGAMRRGVVLNMNVVGGKVTFEANVQAARAHGLALSSKLLRLATEVQQ